MNPSDVFSGIWNFADRVSSGLPLAGRYLAPIHDASIRKGMMGEGHTTKVRDYLELTDDVHFLQQCAAYERLLGNGVVDPPRKYELNEYFIKTRTFDELNLLFKYMDGTADKRNIALVGSKGSGKTAVQNCWLSQHDEELQRRRVVWVRCDGHRLFQLWAKSLRDIEVDRDAFSAESLLGRVSIEEYLGLELVHLFAKHCEDPDRPVIKGVFDRMVACQATFDEPTRRNSTSFLKQSMTNRILEHRALILSHEGTRNKDPRYRFVDEVVLASQNSQHERQKRQWLALSYAVEEVLRQEGVWLLRIVDGVDNIHISKPSSRKYYEAMMKQAAEFLGANPGPHRLHLMALRNRTYDDAKNRQHFPANVVEQIDTRVIEVDPAPPGQIQQRRLDHFMRLADETTSSLFVQILRLVCEHDQTVPNSRFHDNNRTYLHNRLTLIRQVYYRIKQRRQTSPRDQDIRAHVRSLANRNLLLNDRFFLDSKKAWYEIDQELGACMPNIFHFDLNVASTTGAENWWGLCRTRILQVLSRNYMFDEEVALYYLMECWGYPQALVEENVRVLRAYGMIDSTLVSRRVKLELSDAGEAYLHQSFTDIDTLYYSALDTPLPEELIQNDCVMGHSNQLVERTGYRAASMSTAMTMLVFICVVDWIERERFRVRHSAWKERGRPVVFSPGDLPHCTDRGQRDLIRSVNDRWKGADANDEEAFRATCNRLMATCHSVTN